MRRYPKLWYALAVRPGSEGTVRRRMLRQSKVDMIDRMLGRVLVPTQKILTISNGKRRIRRPKKFPGYVITECHLCPHIYKLVRDVKGAIGFLPFGIAPAPIPWEQISPLIAAEKAKRKRAKLTEIYVPYNVGDTVRVTDGGFRDVEGTLLEIDQPTPGAIPVVKVQIEILGRPHTLDLQYWQVKLK